VKTPRLDHVAIAAWKIADAEDFLERELGGRSYEGGPSPEFRWWQWIFAGGGCLEVLEPSGPPRGFVQRFLERSGPGIHHVTFKVESLGAACERAGRFGYEVVGRHEHASGWKEAFLHPKQALGIVVQLAESPDWDAGPPAAPVDSARLLALRMRAAEERARRQWGELLGGACEAHGRELRFRWPDSPVAIAVDVEAGAAEGPEAIEIAGGRSFALPSGRHPLLGARFVRARD
jgi:catechol 2,3-dioxygenase-like lactoylglutathione lyase family enzyme